MELSRVIESSQLFPFDIESTPLIDKSELEGLYLLVNPESENFHLQTMDEFMTLAFQADSIMDKFREDIRGSWEDFAKVEELPRMWTFFNELFITAAAYIVYSKSRHSWIPAEKLYNKLVEDLPNFYSSPMLNADKITCMKIPRLLHHISTLDPDTQDVLPDVFKVMNIAWVCLNLYRPLMES